MSEEAPREGELVRNSTGQFVAGQSGNPGGRPKGSKNKITLLRQSLELQLREQAEPQMASILDKAMELALEGDRQMLKLLLEMWISKSAGADEKATEKVAIQINNVGGPKKAVEVIDVTPTEDEEPQDG